MTTTIKKARKVMILQRDTILKISIDITITILLFMLAFSMGLCYNDLEACTYIEYPQGFGGDIIDVQGNTYLSLQYYPPPSEKFGLVNSLWNWAGYLMLLTVLLIGGRHYGKIKRFIQKSS